MASLSLLLGLLIFSFIITSILIIPFINVLYALKFQRANQKTRDAFGKLTPIFDKFHQQKAGKPVGGGLLVIVVVSLLFAIIFPIIKYFGIEVTYDMYLQYLDLDSDSTEVDSLRRKATFMYRGDKYPELNTNKTYDEGGVTRSGLKFGGNSGLKKHIVGNEKDLNLPLMSNTSSPEHTILLRLADIYLVYVEAVLGNNGTTSDAQALGYFNQIRKRAGWYMGCMDF